MKLLGLLLTVLKIISFFLNVESFNFNAERDVSFLLRVKDKQFNEEDVFQYESRDAIKSSTFDPSKPTTFLIHGFLEDRRNGNHLKLSK